MAYQVIARRFRPQSFADVIGQEHVTRVLEGALRSGRIAHAYLFCGPRGIGKTSTARILARALNCESKTQPTPTPCNDCRICNEIMAGISLDTIEIDGASNRGIDDVRELRENARYAPVGGRYKLYIIDEVHMLTNEAFNALLKTLEEPPAHVVFVFATTEAQKVPPTILSRCQRFDFRRLSVQEIAGQLEAIVEAEKFKIHPGALMVLARRGQGSMRDAESLLEQVMVASDRRQKLDREAVEKLLGLTPTETFLEITRRLADRDAAGALRVLEVSLRDGAHLEELATGLVDHLRNLLLLKVSDALAPATALADDVLDECRELLAAWSKGDIARMLELVAAAVEQMKRSDFPQMHLEMALVRMAELPSTADLRELLDHLGGGGGGGGGGGRHPTASRRSRAGTKELRAAPGKEEVGQTEPGRTQPAGPGRAESGDHTAPGYAAPVAAEPMARSPRLAVDEAAATRSRPAAALSGSGNGVDEAPLSPSASVPAPGGFADAWTRFVARLKDRKAYLGSVMEDALDPELEGGVVRFSFDAEHTFHRQQLQEHRNRSLVLEALRGEFGAEVRFAVRGSEPTPAPPRPPSTARVPLEYTKEVERLVTRFDGLILPES